MAIHLPVATRNAMADACVDLTDVGGAGTLKIYTGSQNATAGALPAGTVLATFTLPNPAFGASASGVATLNAVTTVQGSNTGTAGCFAITNNAGTSVLTGSVTATGGGGDLTLNTTSITTGVDVDITSGTVTMPSGA